MSDQQCPTCRQSLPDSFQPPIMETEAIRLICDEVYKETGVPPGLLTVRSNEQNFVIARSLFAVKARAKGFSYPQIGHMLRRHHTTVMHGVRTYTQKLAA